MPDSPLLRFTNLKARGIVKNRMTLSRWIQEGIFPPGFIIGKRTRVWREDDINAWLSEKENAGSGVTS